MLICYNNNGSSLKAVLTCEHKASRQAGTKWQFVGNSIKNQE